MHTLHMYEDTWYQIDTAGNSESEYVALSVSTEGNLDTNFRTGCNLTAYDLRCIDSSRTFTTPSTVYTLVFPVANDTTPKWLQMIGKNSSTSYTVEYSNYTAVALLYDGVFLLFGTPLQLF